MLQAKNMQPYSAMRPTGKIFPSIQNASPASQEMCNELMLSVCGRGTWHIFHCGAKSALQT